MSDDKPIIKIDIGNLSKPATVLIEKVSAAVGGFYEPIGIVRKAKAEGKARKITAADDLEIAEMQYRAEDRRMSLEVREQKDIESTTTEMKQRAMDRLMHQEVRKDENTKSITLQAAQLLDENANPEALDEDWIAYFFKQCDTVSDKEMQSLWAKVLGGEANKPGSFSKRTIATIATMDKADAELFTTFCQFCWKVGCNTPLILDYRHEVFTKQGITCNKLLYLDSFGLISVETVAGYVEDLQKDTKISYFGNSVIIKFPQDQNNTLPIGVAELTQVGRQLATICGATYNDEFYQYILQSWRDAGYILELQES